MLLDGIPAHQVDQAGKTVAERLAVLVQAIREAENPTRTTIQGMNTGTTATGEKKAVLAFIQPLPGVPEAGSLSITIDGQYLTHDGITEFLEAAQQAGGALTALTVNDNRFKATFTLYARI